jgi:iron complex outermembrane receptor protein
MKKKIAWRQFVISTTILLLTSLSAFSQNNFTVTGKITDEANKPLEGVTVTVQGTTAITTTNADGNFQISVPSGK